MPRLYATLAGRSPPIAPFRSRHRALGAEIVSNTPEEMRAFVRSEMEKWGAAARAAGIQPQ